MKRLLTSPWFIACIGLLAIALVIWFLGPLFAFADARPWESPVARAITIMGVIIVWLVVLLVRQMRSQKTSDAIASQIADQQDEAVPEPERTDELRARFDEAIATLKSTRKRGKRLNLYELPWYVIIGPPGSGKTTALQHSGLHFPLADRHGQGPVEGIGGTRNCDWWFTDEAILLDTAGRYVTQDSDAAADQKEWFGFLDLLKKHRKRRPINGAILCLSLSDILTLSPRQRTDHVSAIRKRLQELYERCGVRVPIYVMFTKSDLLAGFIEFFDDLSTEERKQVWGFTFPATDAPADNPVAEFDREFDLLIERLNQRVLERIQHERDPSRRSLIHDFPVQVKNVKPILSTFLNEIFQGSRFEHVPFVRGVYFTSGTQEGTPIDRLVGTLARNFGFGQQPLPSFHGRGRSFFVANLLRNVIFRESELAGTNPRLERRRAWTQSAAYAGIGLVVLALLAGWAISFARNDAALQALSDPLDGLRTSVATLSSNAPIVEAVAPTLTRVRDIALEYPGTAHAESDPDPESAPETTAGQDAAAPDDIDEPDIPLTMRLGLYQGTKLDDAAQIAYRRLLNEQFLPRVMDTLEDHIRNPDSADFQYETLKRYLMLESPEHYDGTAISTWLALIAGTTRGRSDSLRDYRAHLSALFEDSDEPPPLSRPLDQTLIDRARNQLLRTPLEERIFGRLMLADTGDIRGFDIASAAGPNAPIVFVRTSGDPLSEPLPPMYTPAAFRKVFLPESARIASRMLEERWVLGRDAQFSGPDQALALADRVKDRYMTEYANVYESLLSDLTLAPFGTPRQAASILGALASEPSPIALLIDALIDATNLDPAAGVADALNGAAAGGEEMQAIVNRTGVGQRLSAAGARLSVLERRFDYLHRLRGDGDGPSPLQPILDLLRQLYEFMSLVDTQASRGGVPPHVAQSGEQTLQRLKNEGNRQGQLLQDLLATAADQASGVAFGGISSYINNEWAGGAKRFCDDAIANRFPIVRTAQRDIQMEDFATFFGPGGLIDEFFDNYLAPHVDTTRKPWRLRATDGTGPRISAAALRQFENARAIQDAFFRGSPSLSVSFELTPDEIDTSLQSVSFVLDDNPPLEYSFGPKRPTAFRWPSETNVSETRIQMLPAGPTGRTTQRESGPWSLFRMLDPRSITRVGDSERYHVRFAVDGREAQFVLMAHSAYNPFSLPELTKFRCPTSL